MSGTFFFVLLFADKCNLYFITKLTGFFFQMVYELKNQRQKSYFVLFLHKFPTKVGMVLCQRTKIVANSAGDSISLDTESIDTGDPITSNRKNCLR